MIAESPSKMPESPLETQRLAAVSRYAILDTPPEEAFDRVCALAAGIFDAPVATVSFVDADRIWYKAAVGLDGVTQIPREDGLCGTVVLSDDPYWIADAAADPRARDNRLVRDAPGLRFYAAAPIITPDGHRLGAVGVGDTEPREVDPARLRRLQDLAAIVADQLELRLAAIRQAAITKPDPLPATTSNGVGAELPVSRKLNTITSGLSAWHAGQPPIKVLLIEDDEGDAFLVREWLSDSPVTLSWAQSIAQARPMLADADCVLLDLGLPDASGLDGLLGLRGAGPAVVVLTGYADERQGVAAVAAGAQDYLVKGQADSQVLMRTIRYAVQRRQTDLAQAALLEERLHAQENLRLERGLLPRPLISDPRVVVTSRYETGGRRMLLGGDFYDVIEDRSGGLRIIVGDVAGHGPDQAAVGVALRIAWRTLILSGCPDDEILPVLDTVFTRERHDPYLFTTACTLSIAPDHRSAVMFQAGHPAPLLHAGSGWRQLPQRGGPVLGLVEGARWPRVQLELPATGWALLCFTDGAVEGNNSQGERPLGEAGLTAIAQQVMRGEQDLRDEPGRRLDDLIEQITKYNGGPLSDDLVLLLLTATPR